jgi:polar amino acid transport system substrate-binding protein
MKIAIPMLAAAVLAIGLAGAARAQEQENLWREVQSAGVLRCGAAIAPPHVMRDPKTGEYSGTFVDLCREFGEKVLQVKVEMVDTTWDSIVAGLQAKKWDISLALNRTPTRALAIAFTEPAWQYQISLVSATANPKVPASWKSLADFDKPGVTIAVMSGTAQEHSLSDQVKNATLMRLPDSDGTRLALSSHRADVLADDADSNATFTALNKGGWKTDLPDPAISKQGIAFGLRRETAPTDIEAFNVFLDEKLATGEIQKLGEQYIAKFAQGSQ